MVAFAALEGRVGDVREVLGKTTKAKG
jgi:hypothetical protein